MTTFHVNLPDDLAARLRAHAQGESIEEYVQDLVREHIDQLDLGSLPEILNEEDPELESELLRRLDDPRPGIEATPEFWAEMKRRVHDGERGRQP
jgi:plasmid stability protein